MNYYFKNHVIFIRLNFYEANLFIYLIEVETTVVLYFNYFKTANVK